MKPIVMLVCLGIMGGCSPSSKEVNNSSSGDRLVSQSKPVLTDAQAQVRKYVAEQFERLAAAKADGVEVFRRLLGNDKPALNDATVMWDIYRGAFDAPAVLESVNVRPHPDSGHLTLVNAIVRSGNDQFNFGLIVEPRKENFVATTVRLRPHPKPHKETKAKVQALLSNLYQGSIQDDSDSLQALLAEGVTISSVQEHVHHLLREVGDWGGEVTVEDVLEGSSRLDSEDSSQLSLVVVYRISGAKGTRYLRATLRPHAGQYRVFQVV